MVNAVTVSDLAYLNQVDHTTAAAFDFSAATVNDIIEATKAHQIDPGSAIAEFATRTGNTTDEGELRQITASISAIKALVDVGQIAKVASEASGNFLRLWILCVNRVLFLTGPMMAEASTILSLEDLTGISMQRRSRMTIKRLTTETLFDTAVYQWSLLAHGYGIMPVDISSHFVFDIAFMTRVKHHETFWTAQEYLIECFDKVDRKICTVVKVTDHDRSVMLGDARRNGLLYAGSGPSGPGSAPLVGNQGAVSWNEQFQPATSKANLCQAYNRNRAHDNPRHLDARGKCIFRHLCSRYVTDKGPSGRCLSPSHAWHNCDNPNKTADGKAMV